MHANQETVGWRRSGSIKTSDKLNHILQTFRAPPPPTVGYLIKKDGAIKEHILSNYPSTGSPHHAPSSQAAGEIPVCISPFCNHLIDPIPSPSVGESEHLKEVNLSYSATSPGTCTPVCREQRVSKTYLVVTELLTLIQLSVTATALAVYYILYCYMQIVYYTLRTVLYFHNADGPMKITIGVIVLTSVLIGFNVLLRIDKMVGFGYSKTN